MEVMRAAAEREAEGADVLHLEVGQPSTPAPSGARQAVAAALERDRMGYSDARGRPSLREAIAGHYADQHAVVVDTDRIVATVGASGGCILAFLACFDAGDRVAVTEPGYPCYRNMLEAFDIEAVGIPLEPEHGYRLTPSLLDAAGPLAGLVLASPANPTGTAMDAEGLEAIHSWCATNGTRLIADEIYHGISYGSPLPTATGFEDTVVVQSFSKYFSMTGWRIGWLVLPEHLVDPVTRLAQNLFISPPAVAQVAAEAAFACRPELDANVRRYAENRRVLIDGLRAMGLDRFAPPDGAFYVYADVSDLTGDSQELCARWLSEAGVAVTPGIDFDPDRGHRTVRFSYSESTEDIAEAVARLAAWVEQEHDRSTGG